MSYMWACLYSIYIQYTEAEKPDEMVKYLETMWIDMLSSIIAENDAEK